MYFVKTATVVDVNQLAITYVRKLPGNVVNSHTEWLETRPKGWDYMTFSGDGISYSDFLNTLVEKNVDVCRKMCRIELENILNKKNKNTTRIFLKFMNALCILDPTFRPPIINTDCEWQRQLLREICYSTSFHVIGTCRNCKRMQRYFNVLRALQM